MHHPAAWLEGSKDPKAALILVNNSAVDPERTLKLARYCEKRILLDGAANIYADFLFKNELKVDLAIGDGDSISEQSRALLAAHGVDFLQIADQNSTDMMKGIRYAREQWPEIERIYVFNGYGGRVDHSWHSIYCLGYAARLGIELFILSDENVTMLCPPGVTRVATPLHLVGKTCGLVPMMGSSLVTIKGFEWEVEEWETSFETQLSTSNHLVAEEVSITTDKPLAFTLEVRAGARGGGRGGVRGGGRGGVRAHGKEITL